MSSLATTALYAGTTVGGLVGGVLLVRFPGFFGVSGFSVIALALAFLLFAVVRPCAHDDHLGRQLV
ncbi:MAG: hypothetical protein ABIQ18_16075 [Umezawaea sp.]